MFKSQIVKRAAQTAVVAVAILTPLHAWADEGGVSFWVPGFFGSLAATPQQPGFSFATIGYHTSVKAGGAVAFARKFRAAASPPTLSVVGCEPSGQGQPSHSNTELRVRDPGVRRAGFSPHACSVRPHGD